MMKWDSEDILKLFGGTVLAGVVAWVGHLMGWLRFGKKDTAETNKIEAEIVTERIENEIKITNVALKMAAQYAEQLATANSTIDGLNLKITKMQTDFNLRAQEMQHELEEQKRINTDLMKQLEQFINNGRKKG